LKNEKKSQKPLEKSHKNTGFNRWPWNLKYVGFQATFCGLKQFLNVAQREFEKEVKKEAITMFPPLFWQSSHQNVPP